MTNVIGFLKSLGLNRPSSPVADDNPLPVANYVGGVIVGGTAPLPVSSGRLITQNGTNAFGQTTYGANVGVGGLITVTTTLAANSTIKLNRFLARELLSNVSTPQSLIFTFFEGNPTGSTFTDNVTAALVAADVAKAVHLISAAPTNAPGNMEEWLAIQANQPLEIQLDASSAFFVAVTNPTASLVFGATGTLKWRAEYQQ